MIFATNSKNKRMELPCSIIIGDEYATFVEDYIILDIVNIFSATYIADISTSQKVKRRISVDIPVSIENLNRWNDCKELIVKLLHFVTEGDGDEWSISFIPINYQLPSKQLSFEATDLKILDNVSLLSGGLDSFCGIYENQINKKTALYCGYKTNNMDASYILRVFEVAKKINMKSALCAFNKVGERTNITVSDTKTQQTLAKPVK